MSIPPLLFPVLLAATFAAVPVMAASCPQEKAVYRDGGKTYEIRFQPVTEPAAAISHAFKLSLLATDLVLDGVVLPGDAMQRANGLIMHNCPEGDVTGADLQKCTVWDGVFYSIDDKAGVGDLPAGASDAARQLILSDFGRSAGSSAVWAEKKLSVLPADVLAFEGCAP